MVERTPREALGMVETRGWVGAVEAADAMVKTAKAAQEGGGRRQHDARPPQNAGPARGRSGRRQAAAGGAVATTNDVTGARILTHAACREDDLRERKVWRNPPSATARA